MLRTIRITSLQFYITCALAILTSVTLATPAAVQAQIATPMPSPDAPAKIKLDKLSDLPVFTYTLPEKPSLLMQDPDKVNDLAAQVKTNIEAILAKYDISDATTLRGFYSTLSVIAVLQKDYPTALADIAKVRSLQDKPSDQLTTGLIETAIIDTDIDPGADYATSLGENLDKLLAPLPFGVVQDTIKGTYGQFQILSPNYIIGDISASIDPVASTGQVSQDYAATIVTVGYVLNDVLPYKAVVVASYGKKLDANKSVMKPDIWNERNVTLAPSSKLHPVTIGIWDSGTDVSLFKGKLYNNPNANKDGYVDDYHGTAWTLHSDPSTSLLYPITGTPADIALDRQYLVGFEDVQANIVSPDSTAVKQKLSTLPQAGFKPFLENLEMFGNYAHGTHVSGIAAKGNPAARLLVCRITFDYHLVPECPTIKQAKKDAAASIKQVAFLEAHGARVVNMSWGGDLNGIDTALEANHAGGTPDQRKALARKIFYIGYDALYGAMKKASNILFVPAAGNGDNNVEFDEVLPSDFKLPNIINVGAVDQAGDQTSFTSFGNVDVYADGYQVPSTIPGGDIVKLSGTSMAAPEVTNLVGKMLAIDPKLTPVELKARIIASCTTQTVNGRVIKLIDPKATIAALP